MVAIFRALESQHPKLADLGPRAHDVKKVLNAFASVLDAMLPVRNQANVNTVQLRSQSCSLAVCPGPVGGSLHQTVGSPTSSRWVC